ncbi:MAG: hypothetical protein ABSD20_03490 [Terriglobales bacterium]
MAPFAKERPKRDDTASLFELVRDLLPGEQTPYEQAWHRIVQNVPRESGYPNSAALLTSLWPNLCQYSLLLCEQDEHTIQELRLWLSEIQRTPNCIGAEVYKGDWRDRFRQGIIAAGDLVLISFDPYMFNRHSVKGPNLGNMYPRDLGILTSAVQRTSQATIVQLSTFSANCDNSQEDVIAAIGCLLKDSGLEIVAAVRANGQMMSLVLARNVTWSNCFGSLPNRFQSWLERAKTRHPRG